MFMRNAKIEGSAPLACMAGFNLEHSVEGSVGNDLQPGVRFDGLEAGDYRGAPVTLYTMHLQGSHAWVATPELLRLAGVQGEMPGGRVIHAPAARAYDADAVGCGRAGRRVFRCRDAIRAAPAAVAILPTSTQGGAVAGIEHQAMAREQRFGTANRAHQIESAGPSRDGAPGAARRAHECVRPCLAVYVVAQVARAAEGTPDARLLPAVTGGQREAEVLEPLAQVVVRAKR